MKNIKRQILFEIELRELYHYNGTVRFLRFFCNELFFLFIFYVINLVLFVSVFFHISFISFFLDTFFFVFIILVVFIHFFFNNFLGLCLLLFFFVIFNLPFVHFGKPTANCVSQKTELNMNMCLFTNISKTNRPNPEVQTELNELVLCMFKHL